MRFIVLILAAVIQFSNAISYMSPVCVCVCACISPHSVLIVRNVKRRLISLLTNEIQSAHPHAHYEVFVCVCVRADGRVP